MFLLITNYFLIKKNILIDRHTTSYHKISLLQTPLSGGIFFFFIFFVIDYFINNNLLIYYYFFSLYLILGLLADGKILENPKLRFIFQLIISMAFVIFGEVVLQNTRIYILDDFLKNYWFNVFFLVFCFMTLLNGSNFMDGINGFLTSYFILVLLSIILIEPFTDLKLIFFSNFYFYLVPMIVFFIFNLLNKNFLGDGGSYFLSIFIGINLILFINENNNQIAPFFVVNLLWYPCFENLFTIIRRSKLHSKVYLPDKKHLHTLVYQILENLLKKKLSNSVINSISCVVMIIYLLPLFCFSIYFCDSSVKLFYVLVVYIISYLIIYFKLSSFDKKINT